MAKRKSGTKSKTSTKTTKGQGKTKQTGLGDTVEKVLETVGVDKIVKFIAGEDCGCTDRREILNKAFPYQKPNCLIESEYEYLKRYFEWKPNTIPIDTQKQLVSIYNRVFNDKASTTSCTSCFLNNVHKKLERVYKEYEG
jgi:hypothetical protein